MVKTSLTGHDIVALTNELKFLEDYRVNNIYDITNKSICLKLVKDTDKQYLIIESGTKFYLKKTPFAAMRTMPSSFCAKLRKHVKNKRIALFDQINMDRVIDIQCGTDEYAYHIIAEFYASGNIILTDYQYKILTLIHPYVYKTDETNIRVSTGNIYPKEHSTNDLRNKNITYDEFIKWINKEQHNLEKKIKLKQFLSRCPLSAYGPVLIEHILYEFNIDPKIKVDKETDISTIFSKEILENIFNAIKSLYCQQNMYKGYIFESTVIPFLYNQYKNNSKYTEYDTFNDAVSEYFSHNDVFACIEIDRVKKQEQQSSQYDKAVTNVKNQIHGIETKQDNVIQLIDNIEDDIDILQYMLTYVNMYKNIVDASQELLNNDIENKIKLIELKPHTHSLTFKYNGKEYNWDYRKTAYHNLGNIYTTKKFLDHKIEKANVALEKVESNKHIEDKGDNKWKNVDIIGKKKDNWFEQFNWFYSSDNMLVISGKTADQNELIVKRYMEKNDVYIHSEVPGSGSCIVRNTDNRDISPKTLTEAGCFVICHTKAWKDNVPDQTWWVRSDQVSKTTEPGEYVGKGSFIIRGKKNFMTQPKLELGLGLLFKIKDDPIYHFEGNNNVEYVIPTCGPYTCIQKYKFKVKIIPGSQKIGKLLKEITALFFKEGNMYEKAAMRKISNDDYHRVLITGIRAVFKKN